MGGQRRVAGRGRGVAVEELGGLVAQVAHQAADEGGEVGEPRPRAAQRRAP